MNEPEYLDYRESPIYILLEAWAEVKAMREYYFFMNGHLPGEKPSVSISLITPYTPYDYKAILRMLLTDKEIMDYELNKEPKLWDPILLDPNRQRIGGVYLLTSLENETNPFYKMWMSEYAEATPNPHIKMLRESWEADYRVDWIEPNDLYIMGFK